MPQIDKLAPTPTLYTIGESPSYDIRVSLPEGSAQSLQIIDTLPAGLSYTSFELVPLAANSNGVLTNDFAGTLNPTPTVSNVGNIYTFDFGNTVTNGDNDAANNSFVLRITTKVQNVVGNVRGTTLTNNASVRYTNATTGVQTIADSTPPIITIKEPTLTITKSVNPTSAAPGDTVTFTLTLNNTGDSTAYDISITDVIDTAKFTDITELSTPVDFAYNYSSNTITYSSASLGVGETRTFTFTAKIVTGQTQGSVLNNTVNIAEYSSMAGVVSDERNYGPIPASATVTVATPDLRITKTDNLSAAIPGQNLIYDINVANIGTYRADNIVITETVPTYSTFNAASSDPGWTCVGANCTLNISTIAAGSNQTVQFALTLDSTIPSGVNDFTNTASVTEDGTHGPDPTPLNNQASDTDVLNFDPDLRLSKTDNDFNATVDDVIVYTLSYSNAGSQNATNVIITEQIPTYTTFENTSSTPGWVCGPSSCVFTIGNLNVNQSGTVDFAVRVNSTLPAGVTSTTNNAVISDDGSNGTDINPPDNNATDSTPLEALPDLKITKTDNQTAVTTDQDVTYTITVENVGVQGATGIEVTDPLPLYSSFVSADNGGTFSSNQVKWTGINLNAGQSIVLTVVLHTNPNIPAGVNQFINQVSVIDDGTNGVDLDTSNNQSTDTDNFNAAPELQVTITDNGVSAFPSQNLTYDINYQNNGDQDATGVVLTAVIPPHTSYVSGSNTTAWICPDNNAGTICSYTLPGTLASAGVGQVTFVVLVNSTIPSGVTQTDTTTTITDDGNNSVDPNLTNNEANEITPIVAVPDLTLTKSDGGVLAAIPGQPLIYNLNYANIGNKDTTGVVLYETVPSDSVFDPTNSSAGWSCTPNNNAASNCTLNVGNLNAGSSASSTFAIIPNIPWPIGVLNISNTAFIDDDDQNGIDPNPQAGHDAQSSISTPVTAGTSYFCYKTGQFGCGCCFKQYF